MKRILLMLLFVPLISCMVFGQVSTSATYDLGDIEADPFFLAASQPSSCPGSLAVNIPPGATITGVDVEYDFESISPNYNFEQRSELRCVSPGGINEGVLATSPNFASGVWHYERTGLEIANGVTTGGDIEFELHAGFDNLAAIACGVDYQKVNDGTWTVTVYYLDPTAPVAVTNPMPEDGASDISIDAAQLGWDFGANTETYDLYFGTDNPPTTLVVDNEVSGATGNYDPGTVTGSTNYFWQVVSRNSTKSETAGPVWGFSTECLPIALPVYSDFDNLDAPQWDPNDFIPLCWSKLFECTEAYAQNGVYSTFNAYSAPNCYIMSNEGDGEAWSMLISPQMADDLSSLQLSLMSKSSVFDGILSIGTMSDPVDETTFTLLTTVPSTNAGYVELEVPLTSYVGTDEYIAIRYDAPGPWTWNYYYIDNVMINIAPTCPKPKNLAVANITSGSADLSWLEQGSATQWNIEYDTAGFVPTGTPTFTTTENPHTLTGLDPNTAYDFYVQSDCGGGDLSAWSNPFTFATACIEVPLPIFENFDASLDLPACWNIATTLGTWWQIATSNFHSAPNTFMFYINSTSDNIALVSPQPDVASLSELQLNFWARDSWQGGKMLIVGTMSNPFDVSTFTDVDTIYTTPVMTEYEVWFNNYSGTDTYLAFRPGNVQSYQYLYIDDITIDYLPSCLAPGDLYVDEVSLNSAKVHWTENSSATKWTIEAGIPGFIPGTGSYSKQYVYDPGVPPADYSYVMTGLQAATFYDVYIQTDCGGGDLSEWSKKTHFLTDLQYFMGFPVEETFENGFSITGNDPTNEVAWVVADTLLTDAGSKCAYNAYSGDNENVLLILGKLNLAVFPKVSLSFSQIAKVEGGNDECYIEISLDGGDTFDQLPESTYFGIGNYSQPSGGNPEGPCFNEDSYPAWGNGTEIPDNTWWRTETFDLSSYAGNDQVVIRFRLSSNQWNHRAGWFMDDIVLNTFHGTEIGVSPASIEVTLDQGTSTTEQLTIENMDDFPIAYSATITNYTDAMTTVYYENFDAELPSDWTIEDGGAAQGGDSTWVWVDAAVYGSSLDGTNFMKVQRQYPDTCMESLISPAIDVTGYATTYLSFDQYFAQSNTDYAEVFVWDGAAWVSVYSVSGVITGGWNNPDNKVVNITPYANPDFQVKFYYSATNWSRWAIDNVKVLGYDIPLDWCTINGGTSASGLIFEGESNILDVEISASDFAPSGIWEVNIEIVSNDPTYPLIIVPVIMTIGCDGSPWSFVTTGSVHTISVPSTANPNVFGEPLVPGDWVGVFYIDDDGNEACGGAGEINPFGSAVVTAYGDDPTTPEKDGFDAGERFIWRMFVCSNNIQEYPAGATYDPDKPNMGYFANFGSSKLTSLEVMVCQYYTFTNGWAGISSYINPFESDVEILFAPIVDELTIIRNLTTVYWPEESINTIGDWDYTSGYAMKVNGNVDFEISGPDFVTNELAIVAGWSYIPTLSACEANAMTLFCDNEDDIVIVQELIGTKVFWPAMGIYSLETLEPGNAYKIKTINPFTVTFPECDASLVPKSTAQVNSISTQWGIINMTPSSQLVGLTEEASVDFIEGDIIGAFSQNNQLWGYMEVTGAGIAQSITLFGDDVTTIGQDGFTDGEPVNYKLYRAETGETFALNVEYDNAMENVSGNFYTGSFAAIKGITMGITGVGTVNGGSIQLYPNPATNMVYISINGADYTEASVVIWDTEGRAVISREISGQAELNVSSLEAGIYFVRIKTETMNEIMKLVIK
nr:fibronectin type III domain-containing protein [Bacteroidota bacterium]